MTHKLVGQSALVMGLLFAVVILLGAARPPTEDRVPEAHSEKAKALQSPFGDTWKAPADIVAAGKSLYNGKGQCALCHGADGKGDGPMSHMQANHPPRNFTDCAFQKERHDGELFWIIKYGSPGTGMPASIPHMVNEDEGWKLAAYVRTFCKAGE